MGTPDADLMKIRGASVLAMEMSVEDQPQLAWLYAGWIKQYVEQLMYEDLWESYHGRLELAEGDWDAGVQC